MKQWEIYCSVVDNFGDIGVTWRLARQLVREHQAKVRLRVDDLRSFARLCPDLDPAAPTQLIEGVEISAWPDAGDPWQPADIVIEAFACQLPAPILAAMAEASPPPLWLNLEYLSAEAWIDGCHGLPSLQNNGLQKFFFFPGFSAASGGLLCEADLQTQREAWQADSASRQRWLTLPDGRTLPENSRLYSLFTYESEALPALLHYWSEQPDPVCCLIPEGRILNSLKQYHPAAWQAGDLW